MIFGMSKQLNIWDDDSIVYKYYNDLENFKEIIGNSNKRLCFIFCSSHGVYCPNTVEEFNKTILENDRYDWEKVCQYNNFLNKVSKVIFIRDLFKQYYVSGINSTINSIDRVVDLLKSLTTGYEVVIVGNSAGGYVSTIIGCKLSAKAIFSFAGFFSLKKELEWAPFLIKYEKFPEKNKYYELRTLIKENKVPIFYFWAKGCELDYSQKCESDGLNNIYSFSLNQNEHGNTVAWTNYTYLFTMDYERLKGLSKKYENKVINKWTFLLKTAGILLGVKEIFKRFKREIFIKISKLQKIND